MRRQLEGCRLLDNHFLRTSTCVCDCTHLRATSCVYSHLSRKGNQVDSQSPVKPWHHTLEIELTKSPTFRVRTSLPTSMTFPETSEPGMKGSLGFSWYWPCTCKASAKLRAAAVTFILTCKKLRDLEAIC